MLLKGSYTRDKLRASNYTFKAKSTLVLQKRIASYTQNNLLNKKIQLISK